jgi:hypothetical protein
MSQTQARKQRLRNLQQRYRLYVPYERHKCSYCGDSADNLDHCPALYDLEGLGYDEFTASGGRCLLLPSCRRCNGWLGNKPLRTPQARKQYIAERLEEYWRKSFAAPKWSQDELDQLGPVLGQYVRTAEAFSEFLRRRLSHARFGPI